MPTAIDGDEVRKLTARDAQLVEVLPAEDYQWAHLPGAVSLPEEGSFHDRACKPDPGDHIPACTWTTR